jgi:hypothetical protein
MYKVFYNENLNNPECNIRVVFLPGENKSLFVLGYRRVQVVRTANIRNSNLMVGSVHG